MMAARCSTAGDPLADLIAEVRTGTAAFCATLEKDPDADWDDLADATYGPAIEQLYGATPAPTSLAGALAGLEYVEEELRVHAFSDGLAAVMQASLAFLRSHCPEPGHGQ
jgi:hypothetical protein